MICFKVFQFFVNSRHIYIFTQFPLLADLFLKIPFLELVDHLVG